MAPTAPSALHTDLQRQYDLLTAHLADLDRDASLALSEYDRAIHRDRRALVEADRETVLAYLVAIEKDEPLPGPWPFELAGAEHDTVLRTRLAYKPPGRRDFYAHIPRPELLAGVRTALLNGAGGQALTSSITVRIKADALHGMGGIDRSVATRALCDDRQCRLGSVMAYDDCVRVFGGKLRAATVPEFCQG